MPSTVRQRLQNVSFGEVAAANKWLWSYVGAIIVFLIIVRSSSDPLGTLMASAAFASFYMLVGLGQMVVITLGPGNIDLSVTSVLNLAAFVAMRVMSGVDGNVTAGIIAGLLTGMAAGGFNYALVRLVRIPPMVATLASGFIFQTLSIVFFRGHQIRPPEALSSFATMKLGAVPVLFLIVLAITIIMHFVLRSLPYGRRIHAIGQNPKAAALSGIHMTRVRLITYVLCGTFAALTGILLSAFGGGVTLGMGGEYMLNSVAVPVIGGTSIAGGDSNVPGILGASLLLLLVLYLLNMLGMTVGMRYIVTGAVILAIMFIGSRRNAVV